MIFILGRCRMIIWILAASFYVCSANAQADVKSYIPPSPNAMTFMKYGDYPVDYSTGVPTINIPLYNIDLKGFNYPISASFHASGRSVALNFSPLGMSWALNAYGMISREIKGKVDGLYSHPEQPASYYSSQVQHRDELVALENPKRQNSPGSDLDPEYDIFSISINGISAKFIIRDNGNFVFLTYCPYSITGSISTGFTLTDDKGTIYKFGTETGGYGITELASNVGLTTWCISSITTYNGSFLRFKYGTLTPADQVSRGMGAWNYSDQATIGDWESKTNMPAFTNQVSTLKKTNSNYAESYNMTYLQEITTDNGKVVFTYNNSNMTLQEIRVTNQPGNSLITDIFFDYYSLIPGTNVKNLPNNNSTTIQDIRFVDSYANTGQKYHFDYYEGQLNEPAQATFCTGKDYWGYCNYQYNTVAGTNSIPISSIQILNQPNQNYQQSLGGGPERRAAAYSAKLPGMIKKITFPTGGYTEFVYAANKFLDNSTITDGPGLRVESIVSDDGQGNKISKVYKYGENEDGLGVLMWKPSADDYKTLKIRDFIELMPGEAPSEIGYPTDHSYYRWRVYSSEPSSDLQQAIHQPIYYSKVTEYSYANNALGQNGRIAYTFTSPTYTRPYISMVASETYNAQSFVYDNWSTPQVASKTVEKYVGGTNPFKTVAKTLYNYQSYNDVNIPQVVVYRLHEFPDDDPNYGNYKEIGFMTNPPNYSSFTNGVFQIIDKPIRSGISKLLSETNIQYDDAGNTVSSVKSNVFKTNTDLYPYIVSMDKSNGRRTTSYFTYFADLPVKVINTESADDGSDKYITGGTLTNYYKYGLISNISRLDFASPVSFSSTDASGFPPVQASDFKQKVSIAYDANSNPKTVTPENNIKKSYIWGYSNQYPIAEVVNAGSNEIYFNGFEEGLGWDASLTAYDNNKSNSGRYSGRIDKPTAGELYSRCTTPLTVTIATPTKYRYSAWVYSTGPSVDLYFFMKRQGESGYYTYLDYVTTSVTNKWVLIEKEFTVPADSKLLDVRVDNNGGGTVWFDDVRLYPAASQMTTYTYDPLVGMTSQCDVNNRVTRYEYDSFNRLAYVRDQDGKVVRKICYNYAGQPGDCGAVNVTPNWVATGNLRCATSNGNNTGYQEREEIDNNPTSPSYNQTQWVSNGYNATACPLPVSCTFSAASGFNISTSSISASGNVVSFYIVFYPTTAAMQPGNSYLVATINGGCAPTATRTLNYSSSGRTWTITIYPSGQMYWYLAPGSTSLPTYSTIGTGTLQYNK